MPNPQNIIPPKKGEIRNPKGKPKGTLNSKTILQRMLALTEDVKNPVTGVTEQMSQMEIMLYKVLSNGRKGDLKSVRELLDRLEGKSLQNTAVDLTSNGESIVIYRPEKLPDADNPQA